jgi:hypothetical protein
MPGKSGRPLQCKIFIPAEKTSLFKNVEIINGKNNDDK